MDKNQVREWQAGYEAVNRLTLEEARSRTPAERWAQHKRFLAHLAAMDRLPSRDPADKFYIRWMKIKELWLERHTGPR